MIRKRAFFKKKNLKGMFCPNRKINACKTLEIFKNARAKRPIALNARFYWTLNG
jgi:hypothetical protein